MFGEYKLMIQTGAVILILATAFSSGWKVRDWKAKADEKKAIEQAIENYAKANEKSNVIVKEVIKYRTKVEKEYVYIKKDAVNVDVCSNDFLRLFNNAAGTFNTYAAGGTNESPAGNDTSGNP